MDVYNVKVYHFEGTRQFRLYKKAVKIASEEEKEDNKNRKIENKKKIENVGYEVVNDIIKKRREERSKDVSINRTINCIYGITRANRWDLFLTLTFDRCITDSSDYDLVSARARNWLDNIRKRVCPDLKYILVPELHADKEHWHLHGLLANCEGLHLSDSSHKDNTGRIIYNLDDWNFGFSTVTIVDDTKKVSNYICKYITKDVVLQSKGKRRYWASNNCKKLKDVEVSGFMSEVEKVNLLKLVDERITYLKTVDVPFLNQSIKYVEVDNLE